MKSMPEIDEERNRKLVRDMEQALAAAAEKLQPEMEPATIYVLNPPEVAQ